jgi:uroporphyrinogen-III decarboxylase
MDILEDRERLAVLHDRLDDLMIAMFVEYADAGVEAVMCAEDWGTQDRLLIDPALWREEFKPRFTRLCRVAHDLGIKVWMHSCGQIEAIVPDLMDAGVDLLQFDQPDLHGIDTLAAHQDRGRITFWCPVDVQRTLQTRDEAIIRAKVREMLDKLWRGRGGFIAGYYGDNTAIGLDPKWQAIACEEFERYGVQGYNALAMSHASPSMGSEARSS